MKDLKKMLIFAVVAILIQIIVVSLCYGISLIVNQKYETKETNTIRKN